VVFVLGLAVWIPRIARIVDPAPSAQTRTQDASGLPDTLSHHWGDAAPLVPPATIPGISSPGDELQAIVINPRRRVAVINGQTVGVGHAVAWNGESWMVDSIESKCVVLSQQDGVRQIGLIIRAGGTTEVNPAPPSTAKPVATAPDLLPHADAATRRSTLR
jgi:hypothetical protein